MRSFTQGNQGRFSFEDYMRIPDSFRWMAVSASVVRKFGTSTAIWLGSAIQAQDWSDKSHQGEDGWWYASQVEMEERTGLSDEQQLGARKKLKACGVLEERRGFLRRGASLATIWYRLDVEKLAELSGMESRKTRESDSEKLGKQPPENSDFLHADLPTDIPTERARDVCTSPARAKKKAWEDEQVERFRADWAKMESACDWLPGLTVWGTTRDRAFRRILKDCDKAEPRKTWKSALLGMTDRRQRWEDGSRQGVDHVLVPKNFLRYASWVDAQGADYDWQP